MSHGRSNARVQRCTWLSWDPSGPETAPGQVCFGNMSDTTWSKPSVHKISFFPSFSKGKNATLNITRAGEPGTKINSQAAPQGAGCSHAPPSSPLPRPERPTGPWLPGAEPPTSPLKLLLASVCGSFRLLLLAKASSCTAPPLRPPPLPGLRSTRQNQAFLGLPDPSPCPSLAVSDVVRSQCPCAYRRLSPAAPPLSAAGPLCPACRPRAQLCTCTPPHRGSCAIHTHACAHRYTHVHTRAHTM